MLPGEQAPASRRGVARPCEQQRQPFRAEFIPAAAVVVVAAVPVVLLLFGTQEVPDHKLTQGMARSLRGLVVELIVNSSIDPALARFRRRRVEASERPGV